MNRTRTIFACALALTLLSAIGGIAADSGTPTTGVPFTEVSGDRCGACHGPGGKAPRVDMNQGDCRSCHGGSHEDGLSMVKDAPAHDNPAPYPPKGPADLTRMVLIPAGETIIGNDGREITEGKGNLDETPEHTVFLSAYYIDKYEVTNADYAAFVAATGHRKPRHWKGGSIPDGKDNHPVVYVSWFDANAYCHWAGGRLPTELEWEKAARGTEGRVFPWGNRFDTAKANTPQRWAKMGEDGGTMPVGSFEAGKSPYGLYDMAGNVWEWTSSWYRPYPGNQYPNNFYGFKNRVLKGGSWYDCLSYGCGLSAPSYNRSRFTPGIRNNSFGFRCAAPVPAADKRKKPA